MNNLRKAAAAAVLIVQRDPKTGKAVTERVNEARRVKRELGLSGRQLKKLRKQIAREYREQQRLVLYGDPTAPAPQGVIEAGGLIANAAPRRPRPGP